MPIDPELVGGLHLERMRRDAAAADPARAEVAFQTSTIAALLDGAYDGDMTLGEVVRHGDLGLGTVEALDGELVVLDGELWRAGADGRVTRLAPEVRTPFAAVVPFRPDRAAELDGPLDLDGLRARIDALAPGVPALALRVDGRFARVRARSVPRQRPPYRPLAEVVAEQSVFELPPGDGTLVGFRFPPAAGGVEVAGDHLHFLSRDRRAGGHVLELELASGRLSVDPVSELHVEVPRGLRLAAGAVADPGLIDRVERGVDA
jgi:acetolactate decarboxylase